MLISFEKMKMLSTNFIKDESGATAIEYGLLAALIGVAIIGGAKVLGKNTKNLLDCASGSIRLVERAEAVCSKV